MDLASKKQDFEKALEYEQKGADLGYTGAMLNLAYLYANGKGTDVDLEKACEYYAKADYYGDKSGSEALIDLLNAGKITLETANKWMDYYYKQYR